MAKPALDLKGKRFGRLTAIARATGKSRFSWLCKCDCGNTTTVLTSSLRSSETKSCGCLRREKTGSINGTGDLTGMRFGRLKVVSRAIPSQDGKNWLCECDCGVIKAIPSCRLKIGATKSCGCLRRDVMRIDLTGQKFGKLTVISFAESKGRDGTKWLCKCDCGQTKVVLAKLLKSGATKSCGCLARKGNKPKT